MNPRTIITTNFDSLFEKALGDAETAHAVIRDDDEADDYSPQASDSIPVFKPHGCLSKPESMRFRLDEIQRLSNSKKRLLQHLMADRPLLVMGYSGNDEDFFPVMHDCITTNSARSCVVVFPGSLPQEPIQSLMLSSTEKLQILISDPTDVLRILSSKLLHDRSLPTDENKEGPLNLIRDWKDAITEEVNDLSIFSIATCVAQLLSTEGNHRDSLNFASLAHQVYDAAHDATDVALWWLLEIEARGLKELGEFEQAQEKHAERNRLAEKIGMPYLVDTTILDKAHADLRRNDLEAAEKSLSRLGAVFASGADFSATSETPGVRLQQFETTSEKEMLYYWYFGILKRKTGTLNRNSADHKQAERSMLRAATIAKGKQDIWHEGRIVLDLALVKQDQGLTTGNEADLEVSQKFFGVAIDIAKQATDWSTAAKAAKNRGALLGISDKPHLARDELLQAVEYFRLAEDPDGERRTRRMIEYSRADFISHFFELPNQVK